MEAFSLGWMRFLERFFEGAESAGRCCRVGGRWVRHTAGKRLIVSSSGISPRVSEEVIEYWGGMLLRVV